MKILVALLGTISLASFSLAGCSDDDSPDGEENPSAGTGGTTTAGGNTGSSGKSSGSKGGSSGSTSSSGDAGSGAGGAPLDCTAEGEDCEPSSMDCCEGACIESDSPGFAGCRPLCEDHGDCDSGCCQPFSDAGGGFCVDAAYCSCVEQDGACGPTVASPCCEGSTCAITEGPYLCQQICTSGDECPENCCVPLPNTDLDICGPADFCL